MILISLIILIYYNTGLLSVLAFIVWYINLIMTAQILIIDPKHFWIRIVHLLSIFFITYIIFLNINILYENTYKLSYAIPLYLNNNQFSKNKITYLHEFIDHDICIFNDVYVTIFHFSDSIDVKLFLSELLKDKIYVVNFEFAHSMDLYDSDGPNIMLSKPILINKESSEKLISDFIKNRINELSNRHLLEQLIINSNSSLDFSAVIVRFKEINLSNLF